MIEFEKFNLSYDKSRVKSVLLFLPLHRENLTSYLSPVLGQYAIKNVDFLNHFIELFTKSTYNKNIKSLFNIEKPEEVGFMDEELTIPLSLFVYKAGKFQIQIHYPQVGFLYSSRFKRRRVIFKKPHVFRHYKRLLHLTLISLLPMMSTNNININVKAKEVYWMVRNALFQKTM